MSDTMLLGVLRMPVNENDPLCIAQFVQRARQAADRIESDAAEITRLQSEVERLKGLLDNAEQDCRNRIKRDRIYCMEHGDEATKEMAFRAKHAEDEVERLRGRCGELEEGLRTITDYPDVREYVGTICHDAALSALGGVGDAWLLRKQAEAVERFGQEIGVFDPEYDDQEYVEIPRREVMGYAQRLRQQAAEINGGE